MKAPTISAQAKHQRIYQVIQLIPQGKVASYGQIADLAGLPRQARYISKVLKQAPDSLDLAWHRIVSSQGKISIPSHTPLHQEQKQRLIAEGVIFKGERILAEHRWQPDLYLLLTQLDH